MRTAPILLPSLLGLVAVTGLAAAESAAGSEDAWEVLAAARDSLERAAWTADFEQTYLPAGFSSGDSESGRVSLALPGHLRWDYEAPHPKVFLVRMDTAYSWNPGEASGRRTVLAEEERRHLALLRLDLAELRGRYAAAATEVDEGVAIDLAPTEPDAEIRHARLTVDPLSDRLLAVRYSDLEGNTTEFRLSGHRPAEGDELFQPPSGLEWLEE